MIRVAARQTTRFFAMTISLVLAIAASIDPLLFVDARGRVDHAALSLLFIAMSVGFVVGISYVPRRAWWRAVFSPMSFLVTLALAAGALCRQGFS